MRRRTLGWSGYSRSASFCTCWPPPCRSGSLITSTTALPTGFGTTTRGPALASSYRHFDFSVPGKRLVGDGMVSAIAASVFAIIGVNQVGAFLIFSFGAWLGLLFFYRAFSLTFAGANHRRYAILLFFLPSLIFWTADVSKEAIMTLSLGLAAFGAAKILARRRGGFVLLIIGAALGAVVRPNELLLLLAWILHRATDPPCGPSPNTGGSEARWQRRLSLGPAGGFCLSN